MTKIAKWGIAFLVIFASIAAINIVRVNTAASAASRYQNDVTVYAYYHLGVAPNSIVFDLWRVGWGATQAEVIGVFLRFADQMKDREFGEIRLAYRGKTKFILDGEDFHDIGREFSYQNPVYVIRTFPEKLRTPGGRRAFSTWSGGVLGVLGKQMEDLNDLGRRWYLNDMLSD